MLHYFTKWKRPVTSPSLDVNIVLWRLLKDSKCCIQNHLGAPFVVYKFARGRILIRYAVISPLSKGDKTFVFDS